MEKKALAIVFALQQFAPYIEGNGVTTVRTDNQPICALLKKQNLPPRLQRFQLAIQSYNIDLHHQSGDSNKMCDFLSRYPVANPGNEDLVALLIADIEAQKIDEEAEPEDNEKETPQVSLDEIREEQLKIPEYKKLIDALEAKIPEAVANFELKDRLCHLIQQPNLRKPLAKFLAEASEMAKKLIHKDISLEDIVSFLNVLVTTELDYFKDGKSPTTSDTYINAKNLLTAIPVNAAEKGEKHTDTEDDERPDDSLWQVNDLQINDLDDATHADETQEQTKDDA
ncbi:hypothetical protein QR680_011596 [Steinernema hermaphroditum]|uniref:Reverse transcriptase RNase H-like domain-containing protein n=1 Tax=Steinernema hermaphroditum TaxID=289476 RepID=A0AA39LYC4_9BILA|nr:hypothetical protein QR680_011596 [Steinernema hermaphroditum]